MNYYSNFISCCYFIYVCILFLIIFFVFVSIFSMAQRVKNAQRVFHIAPNNSSPKNVFLEENMFFHLFAFLMMYSGYKSWETFFLLFLCLLIKYSKEKVRKGKIMGFKILYENESPAWDWPEVISLNTLGSTKQHSTNLQDFIYLWTNHKDWKMH